VAREHGLAAGDAAARLARARARLLDVRALRPRPHRDDKVLTAWNGLMISAFARGARALDDPSLAAAATRAAEFVWTHLRDAADGTLKRRWRDGEAAFAGQLDDHAYFAYGLIDLYRATLDVVWLERAIAMAEALMTTFADDAGGGLFESPAGDPHVAVRLKSDFDGAENSGASIAALVLLSLGRLLDRRDWLERVERLLDLHARRLAHGPTAMPQMLVAMDVAREAPRHVVIAGRRDADDTRALIRAFDAQADPEDLLLLTEPGDAGRRLAALAPFTGGLDSRDGRATAYVCVHYACRLPSHDPTTFAAQLAEPAPSSPTGVQA
jgi:hypothetical protein